MSLLKNVLSVAISNVASYGTRIISTIMLPIVLSQEGYGAYSKYLSLLSLTYLFNFGYNDGIYIKYGGVDPEDLDQKEVHTEHNFVQVFQLFIFVLMLIYGVANKNIILVFFSFSTLFDTLITYHQHLLQATGMFDIYSKGNIYRSAYQFFALLVVMFIFNATSPEAYIILNISNFIFLFLFYSWNFYKTLGFSTAWDLTGKGSLFKTGIFILIANASLTLAGNMGAYVGGANFSNEIFAQYGFQNSILNAILLVANAVGMVFYNLIAKRSEESLLDLLKKACVLLGIYSGIFFFFIKFFIEDLLPLFTSSDYRPALTLLSITFIAIPYIMTSRMVIANIYKVTVPVKVYVKDSLLYVLASAILVFAAYYQFRSLAAIAAATTLSYFLWFLYTTEYKFKYLSNSWRAYVLMASHAIIFYLTANAPHFLLGFFLYAIYLLIITHFMEDDIRQLLALLKA